MTESGSGSATALRVGVRRSDRPRRVVALAEARVIRWELERRVGPVTLDLRIEGEPLGPWQPVEHAAGPSGVDATVALDELRPDGVLPLTRLFTRSVGPDAAATRTGMLRHLGVLPFEPFILDAEMLDRLDPVRLRPTDLWIVTRAADAVTVDDPAIVAFADEATDPAPLDAAFDQLAEQLAGAPAGAAQLARLVAERDELRARLTDSEEAAARDAADAARRIAELEGIAAVWRERCERAEAELAVTPPPPETA